MGSKTRKRVDSGLRKEYKYEGLFRSEERRVGKECRL